LKTEGARKIRDLFSPYVDSCELEGVAVTTHEERLDYTVELVAVNAIMAGCRPEHLPVVLALAASKQASMPSSTTTFISMMVVNGPVRNEIGMNCSSGALSPFNFANSVIGRAWTLLSINLGGAKIAENFTASTGNGVNYNNMCCGENEELSIWEPFHVQKGFKANESTVSLFRGWTVIGFGDGHAGRMAEVMKNVGMAGATFIVDPLAAKNLKNEGFKTKQELASYLAENAKPEIPRPRMPTADNIDFVVVGGEWNPFWMTTDFHYTHTFAIDKWIPKSGIRKDPRPLRMPAAINCSEGVCGLPGIPH